MEDAKNVISIVGQMVSKGVVFPMIAQTIEKYLTVQVHAVTVLITLTLIQTIHCVLQTLAKIQQTSTY